MCACTRGGGGARARGSEAAAAARARATSDGGAAREATLATRRPRGVARRGPDAWTSVAGASHPRPPESPAPPPSHSPRPGAFRGPPLPRPAPGDAFHPRHCPAGHSAAALSGAASRVWPVPDSVQERLVHVTGLRGPPRAGMSGAPGSWGWPAQDGSGHGTTGRESRRVFRVAGVEVWDGHGRDTEGRQGR